MFKRKKKDTKDCPFCAKEIKIEATVCRYCREDLPGPDAPPDEEKKPGPLSGCVQPIFIGMLMLVLLVIFATNNPTENTNLPQEEVVATDTQEQRNDIDGILPDQYLTPSPITGPCSNGCLYKHLEEDCFIKADYDSMDKPFYFLPIDTPYETIVIDIDLGERWFCSATDAEALGFERWSE